MNTASSGLHLSGDRPRATIAEDRLGYEGFARALAQSIHSLVPPDGFVIGIHGSWGSGKTSAVNMVVEALGELEAGDSRPTLVVRFNPWWFSEQENLVRAFFADLTASLEGKISNNVVEGLKKLARKVSGAKGAASALAGLLPGGDVLKALTEAGFDVAGEWAADEKSLDELRNAVQAALTKEGRRILVIVDDLDRLPADEARQIFRLVKSVADLPYVVYLLVFDKVIAGRALSHGGLSTSPDWLEKIIQAPFDLPPVHPTDIHALLFDALNEVVGPEAPIEPSRWPDVFHKAVAPWLRTPRDAVRLGNGIAVLWPVVGPEVDLADLVAIET
ncbi:MAG TPA: P-loop NTPase fold protein, partial [Reyranella sp.]|nr:P-loop NTPase fold protein [Reyranella sp.]